MAVIFGDEIDADEVLAQHGEKALAHTHHVVVDDNQEKEDYA